MLTRLRRWPVAVRMLVSALVLVLVILPLAGTLLAWNFRQTVSQSFDERLMSFLNVVIAGIEFDPQTGDLTPGSQLGDPRFERVYSGWYWQVNDNGGRVITSRSLWDQRLPQVSGRGPNWVQTPGPRGQRLRLVERDIQLPAFNGWLSVSVAADLTEVDAQVARFNRLLAISLTTLGVLLLLMIGLQIRWGLAPLRRLEQDLRAMEAGRAHSLGSDLPDELARLADAMNQVLQRDQVLIERGRTAAGNLAHALKTPVSVLTTLSDKLPAEQRTAFRTELARIDDAVRHHLARASAAGPAALGGVDLADALEPVLSALGTLAGRRGLALERQINGSGMVRFEQQDLQEIAGNLLENAINWAENRVSFSARLGVEGLELVIEDDGPGLSADDIEQALTRGARLDESRSGSGLGLAIVKELVELYGGSLELARSPLGGLRASARFPA